MLSFIKEKWDMGSGSFRGTIYNVDDRNDPLSGD